MSISKKDDRSEKQKRLAAALRANLKRRKQPIEENKDAKHKPDLSSSESKFVPLTNELDKSKAKGDNG